MHARAVVIHVVMVLAVVVGTTAPGAARPKITAAKAPASVDAELITAHATARAPTGTPGRGKHATRRRPPPSQQLPRHAALGKPPFAAYKHFAVLRRGAAILAKGMAWKTKLPNNRDLMISLKDIIVSRKPDEPMRFVIVASLAQTGTTAFKTIVQTEVIAGEPFFIPAETYRGGIVVVSVKLLPH